jgi:mersacidin/lichenicidin family type 2 lantibiotic
MKFDLVRSWKDETYRQQFSAQDLPANPAGELELNDAQLEIIHGAHHSSSGGYANTNALICLQSVLGYCSTINGNCGNA